MHLFRALVFVCASLALAASAHAERRVALVIGNDSYPNLPAAQQLGKAVADSRAVRDTLGRLGFDVIHAENATLARAKDLLFEFSARLGEGDIAFVFYAGHGVALGGANFLLPSDIPTIRAPESEAAIRAEEERLAEFAIGEEFVSRRIKATGARVGIVVFDACRDNPLRLAEAANPFRSTRPGDLVFGASRGLARVESRPEGIFALYSANFGQRALDALGPDDPHPNSPFTRVLLEKLATPGLGVRDVMIETREEVVRLTRAIGVEQRPTLYDEVTGGDVYLSGAPASDVDRPAVDAIAADYALAERIGTEAAWDAFLARYQDRPGDFHVNLARAAREKLALGIFPDEPAAPPSPQAPTACDGGVVTKVAGAPRCLKPGDTFRDCDQCPEMVVIPAGSFTMGSPVSEEGRNDNEGPQHEVTIAAPFAVGKFEVTFDEWDACIAAGGCGDGSDRTAFDMGWGRGNRPVIMVTWHEVNSYLVWLARDIDEEYRLLSEGEWEYAARAGTTTRYYFGDREPELCLYANAADSSASFDWRNKTCSVGVSEGTAAIGRYRPNAFGLYDMHGNVSEWVEDCWNENYRGAPADGSAWTSGDCVRRVLRGGHWSNHPFHTRAASRDHAPRGLRAYNYGFRVARTLGAH
ncbi:MAG: SUMF1/EgtB/PvdO family nonheme iron enzyme [Propylenella sp.]